MVISTLVLKPLPLDTLFSTMTFLLKPGSDVNNGRGLITNMHAEMGRLSQAGFSDEIEGKKTKVRGESYVYEIEEVVEEGKKWRFHFVGGVLERTVEITDIEEDGSGLKLGRGGRKEDVVRNGDAEETPTKQFSTGKQSVTHIANGLDCQEL
ncbi:hypothetical protein BCON_0057g00380 [Botryotinia convoluta]|uniref:Uncharacterized protein n=1 Tax=Botryotinia convoluta TaxID=54673 RepID=A0A4Z1IGI6_9HELO|nr:hypothetical protein BCON_0057g00380 [Botryotinia convoluta]